jgi:phage FluMu protein gp41
LALAGCPAKTAHRLTIINVEAWNASYHVGGCLRRNVIEVGGLEGAFAVGQVWQGVRRDYGRVDNFCRLRQSRRQANRVQENKRCSRKSQCAIRDQTHGYFPAQNKL